MAATGNQKSRDATLKLVDLGVTKSQSSRWQKLASLEQGEFEQRAEAAKREAVRSVEAPAGERLRENSNGARREEQLGAKQRALPDARYGEILADPEWRCEPRSWSPAWIFRSEGGPSARLFFRGGGNMDGLKIEPAMGLPGFSLLARWARAGRAPDGATRVVRISPGALGRRREPRHGICAHRAPCAPLPAPTLDLFPRPFWLPVARTGQRRGADASRAPFGGLSRGSRVFPGPFSPCAAAAVRKLKASSIEG